MIGDLRFVGKRLKAVSEAFWDVKRLPVLGCQLKPLPSEIGGRPGSQIDDHIEDPAARAPHNLGLFIRRSLEMESAHRAAVPVIRKALLGDLSIEALRREFLPTPGARKEAAFVFSRLDVDQACVIELRRDEDHSDWPIPFCSSRGRQ